MTRENTVEARSPFSKRLLPGASHGDQAYLHGLLSHEYSERARAAHEQFLRSAGWRNIAKRRRLLKYIKQNNKLAVKHSKLHDYHTAKHESLGDKDIRSTGNRLRDWWRRANMPDTLHTPHFEHNTHERDSSHNNYDSSGVHVPPSLHSEPDDTGHKESEPTNDEQAEHDRLVAHHKARIDHHDEQAAHHEAEMLKADREARQHDPKSAKFRSLDRKRAYHEAEYNKNASDAEEHQKKYDHLTGSNAVKQHGGKDEEKEESNPLDEHKQAALALGHHYKYVSNNLSGLSPSERKKAEKHLKNVSDSIASHNRASSYFAGKQPNVDHAKEAEDHKQAIQNLKPIYDKAKAAHEENPDDKETADTFKSLHKSLSSHKVAQNHHKKLSESSEVKAKPPIEQKETEPDDHDAVNTFFKSMTPEQREGYSHHHPESPMATAHTGVTALPNHNHEQMKDYHEGMAEHHLSQAEKAERKGEDAKHETEQAKEDAVKEAPKSASQHIKDIYTHTHNLNKANSVFEHQEHAAKLQNSIDDARRAGVKPKFLEGQIKNADKLSKKRLNSPILAEMKRNLASNHAQLAGWHNAKNSNLQSNPDKPIPKPVKHPIPENDSDEKPVKLSKAPKQKKPNGRSQPPLKLPKQPNKTSMPKQPSIRQAQRKENNHPMTPPKPPKVTL